MTIVHQSTIDKSINYISPYGQSFVESRFVQRNSDYIIVYLSSHNGCARSCRFCHLTQTGQTEELDVDLEGYLSQARAVLQNVVFDDQIEKVHFNFMARGEPLNNKFFVENSTLIFNELAALVPENVESKFLVSSIIPKGLEIELSEIFKDKRSTLYYSMYSVSDDFRKRWLPKARDVNYALQSIWAAQKTAGINLKIHHSFISGENDSILDAKLLCERLRLYGINPDFNIIAYNPYDSSCGKESSIIIAFTIAQIYRNYFPEAKIKFIDRVGQDVSASCGMFFSEKQ